MRFFRSNPYAALEKALGYRFRKRQRLVTALAHPSYRFENADVNDDNQRLEFLGDAALGLVASAYLFEIHPDLREGGMTRLRSRLTNSTALARVGHALGLGEFLLLGKGETSSGGRKRDSNVLDAMEAILGAAFLDGGLPAVRRIFMKNFVALIDVDPDDIWSDNPKGHLQALAQKRWKSGPRYELLERNGATAAGRVVVAVSVGKHAQAVGTAATRREAECRAAMKLLASLQPRRRRR